MKDDAMSISAQGHADALEPDPVIEVYKRDVDRSLLRENLKLTVDGRFVNLGQLQRFAEELRRAGRAALPRACRSRSTHRASSED